MSRIPASTSVALAGLLPACAAALGLGEVESRSFLNQPLAAEIPVIGEAAGELAGLSVSLASPDTFAQYGLPRPALLGDLRFTVVDTGRGGVIRISSTQPVVEPFLTLLLEVNWPQGRLLREFTVLLDPPDFAAGAVEAPAQQPVPVRAPESGRPASAAVRSQPSAARTDAGTADAAPAPRAAPAVPSPAPDTHTVARNETLWAIADRYRPDAATSINQVMVSIYRANPDAFRGNMNRLRAGSVLRIPGKEALQSIDRRAAGAEVQREGDEWRTGRAAAPPPARLELVPPPEASAPAPGQAAAPAESDGRSAAELEETRRLLAVKDAELKALRERIAELERASGEVAVEEPVPPPAEPPVAQEAPEAAAPAVAAKPPPKPAIARPAAQPETPGLVDTVVGLLTSVWLWVAAAIVLVAALLIARRRSAAEEPEPWRPTSPRQVVPATTSAAAGDESMIVQEEPARASGRFERRALAREGDEETTLERTISTDGPVNLDQADPLAEAEFHMAYGLYDQAADLLTAAVGREPSRRDLRLKLLDVYFMWENRDGFLKEARAFRERVGNESDPDWKRVVIMGKQICPSEALFAAGAAPAAGEMDLALSEAAEEGIDLDIGSEAGSLDFDLGTAGPDLDSSSATTRGFQEWGSAGAQTQELPTLEVPGMELAGTRETPTLENPSLGSTLETPTVETNVGERTMETPTLETRLPDVGATARLRTEASGDERSDQTAEIDLEDLGLDLAGLDDAARDMATGLHEAVAAGPADIDFDLGAGDAGLEPGDSTAEMEKAPSLSHLSNAMGKTEGSRPGIGADDTVDQPGAGGFATDRTLGATGDDLQALNIDLDLGSPEPSQADLTATGLRALGGGRAPDDATMTEVGTKLDLARAYLDMGDPDGARSILNEVIEEGDPAQRQEARQLLDGLDR